MSIVPPDYGNLAAAAIGKQLADSAASAAGSFVIGQLMSALDMNTDPSAQILDELGQILAGIGQIEADLTALKQDMDVQFAELEYNTLIGQVTTSISSNAEITGAFSDYTNATDDTDRTTAKNVLKGFIVDSLDAGPSAWARVLGSSADAGPTNLIAEWSKIVYQRYPFFGADASNAMGIHWAWLDAQQAQAVLYAIEWFHRKGDSAGALRTLKQWQVDRTAQLALLRGMPYATDTFTYTDAGETNTTPVSVTTNVKSLPAGITITNIWGAPMMYDLTLRGPVRHGDGMNYDDFNTAYNVIAQSAGGSSGFPTQSVSTLVPTSWNVPDDNTMVQFLNACGGSVGGGGADTFEQAVLGQGFQVSTSNLMLWTDVSRNSDGSPVTVERGMNGEYVAYPERSVFVEGSSWWNPSTDPNDEAFLLFQRNLDDGEADNYWYS